MTYNLFTYPLTAGAKEETTSRDAAEAIESTGRAGTLRDKVFRLFLKGYQATADEVASVLDEQPFTIRPRITELFKTGVIERTGQRRISAGGRPGHVYRLVVK